MKKIFLLISIFFTFVAVSALPNVEIVPQTEAFILSAQKDKLYIKILNGPLKNKLLWVSFNFNEPSGKIFSANPIDRLSSPTNKIEDALYIQFPFQVTGVLDEESFNEEMKRRLDKYLFTTLDRYVPISNQNVPDVAEDFAISCPERPKRKNGEFCHKASAFKLSTLLKEIVKEEALKVNEDPALVASIIQHESLFDVFTENLHEKRTCLENQEACSPYRWGVGLAQLGQTDAPIYGLNWNLKVKRPKECKNQSINGDKCLTKLLKVCKKYNDLELKPINCPRAAIRAAALKISKMIPESFPVWVKQDGKIEQVDLTPELKKDPIETLRNKVGLYNRSIKVMNSFVEYFDQHGSFPSSYGSAWAALRTPRSPSISMGYQMLTKEYINRCYVWEVAGLCGELPEQSLISQFNQQFQ